MQLSPDCIRDILITMESANYGEEFTPEQICEMLPQYKKCEINYNIIKLKEAGFINAIIKCYDNRVVIVRLIDITYHGHQFLADIRSDTVWNDVKKVSKNIGSNSLRALAQIASGVITAIINHQLGLN